MGSLPDLSVVRGEQVPVEHLPVYLQIETSLQTTQADEHVAVIFEDDDSTTTLTYKQLNSSANSLGRAILGRVGIHTNVDGDCVVAVCMQRTHKMVQAFLGIWKAGAAYLPLDPSFPQQRVEHILTDANPALLVHDGTANEDFFKGTQYISFDELIAEASKLDSSNLEQSQRVGQTTEQLAIVLYTSGSTGIPKGVRLTHPAICNRLSWQLRTFPHSLRNDVLSTPRPILAFKTAATFVDHVSELWAPLMRADACVLVVRARDTRDPTVLVEKLARYQIPRLVLVPTLLRSILMYLSLKPEDKPLKHLKLWICSGEILTKQLAGEFFSYFSGSDGHVLCNYYGSTEVMGDVTFYDMRSAEQLHEHDTVPIGKPLDNTVIYLLDENMQPVCAGKDGELWASGANLASGYVGGKNADRFVDNPLATAPAFSRLYRTGDFARLEKGSLLYSGRTDSQIKIRGHRVDLVEVERAVTALSGVDKAVVLCYKAGEMDQALLSFVTPNKGANITGMFVEGLLQDKLAPYMIPQVIVLDSIPLLVNGKVDRQALLKMYENTNNNDDYTISIEIDYSGVRPCDMTAAEILFETVGGVIGRSTRHSLSIHSNFYQLGGNSLNSIYTIMQLKEQGYYIEISDFLSAKNLGEVLSKLSTNPHQQILDRKSSDFVMEPLTMDHEKESVDMIVSSFYEKAELEQWLKSEINRGDYQVLLGECWEALVKAGLSFLVKDTKGTPVAVALNLDARDEPEIEIHTALKYIMEFLESIEGPIRDSQLPAGKGAILHSFMMATHETLSPQQNVAAIRYMEDRTEDIARSQKYEGIFTTNTSPLTQQLAIDVLGYQAMLDYQVNQFVASDGRRVFARAPDDQRAIVCWKTIDNKL